MAVRRTDRLDERTFPEVALNDLEGEGAWVQGLRYSVDMCWTTGGYAAESEARAMAAGLADDAD